MTNKLGSKGPLDLVGGVVSQIRLAGMGAIAKIQEEGGKLISGLIQEGARIEAMIKGPAAPPKAEKVKPKTAEEVQALERLFDDRVARSLQRLNIPTQEDIRKLASEMETLNKSLKTLTKPEKKKPSTET